MRASEWLIDLNSVHAERRPLGLQGDGARLRRASLHETLPLKDRATCGRVVAVLLGRYVPRGRGAARAALNKAGNVAQGTRYVGTEGLARGRVKQAQPALDGLACTRVRSWAAAWPPSP